MRAFARAAIACLTLAFLTPPHVLAQPAAPSAPIPYNVYKKKFEPAQPAKPKPAPGKRTTVAAGASTAATVTPIAPLRPGARLAGGQPMPPAELEAFVDGVVRSAMRRDHVAGVTVSVVQGGQVVLKKGYGYASLKPLRPVDPDRTLFRLGSISKTFTWIALMKEVEAGRIRLNSPINLYLPERVQVRDQGYAQPMLVRHLMDHSAGFEDRIFGHLFERDFARVRPLEVYLRQERPQRVRAPGVLSSYSNYGAGLAGEAVAYVGGQPFETLVERQITGPLGLSRTTFREPHPPKAGLPAPMPAALAADVAVGQTWTATGFKATPFEYVEQVGPAGAVSSTAGDMARYMLLLLGGGTLDGVTVYGPRTAQAFRTPLRPTPPGINGWGHGFVLYTLPGGWRGFGHDGGTLAFLSNMTVAPELGLGVFVSANTDTGGPLAEQLAGQIVERFYAPPKAPPTAQRALAEAREMFAGDYLSTRRAYRGLEAFIGRLIWSAAVDVSPDGMLTVSTITDTGRFALDGPPAEGRFVGADQPGALAFTMANGRATAFRTYGNAQTFERVDALQSPALLGLLGSLALLAAAATLVGAGLRMRRDVRQGAVQRRASLIQSIQAGLWLVAAIGLGIFVAGSADRARLVYGWPGGWLVTASACALVASLLTLVTLVLLPLVWRGGRRVESWTNGRKLAFTLTVLIYGALGVMLARWGALAPWSG